MMSEIELDSDKTSFRVELRQYTEGKLGKRLVTTVKIQSRDYNTFCNIVENVQKVIDE